MESGGWWWRGVGGGGGWGGGMVVGTRDTIIFITLSKSGTFIRAIKSWTPFEFDSVGY